MKAAVPDPRLLLCDRGPPCSNLTALSFVFSSCIALPGFFFFGSQIHRGVEDRMHAKRAGRQCLVAPVAGRHSNIILISFP